uniref:Uncharacterized protein n=1 Tax=viral metagenome TaxID=1070528 RepID=A0A6C0EG13_9ZZZZ
MDIILTMRGFIIIIVKNSKRSIQTTRKIFLIITMLIQFVFFTKKNVK